MLSLSSFALLASAVLLIYRIISRGKAELRFKAFARAHNCHEPWSEDDPNTWLPWSLKFMYKLTRSRQDGKDPLDDYFTPPFKKHTTFTRTKLLNERGIETVDPAIAQACFSTDFDKWIVPTRRNNAGLFFFGHSIFSSNGEFWKHSRKMLRPQFTRDVINDVEGNERGVSLLIEAFGSRKEGWTDYVDVVPLLYRFVLDNATEFLFGESMRSQEAGMASSKSDNIINKPANADQAQQFAAGAEFAKAFDDCSYYWVTKVRLQALGWLYNTQGMKTASKTIRLISDRYVDKALARRNGKDEIERKFDLLSTMIEQTQDKDELRDQAISVLVAGRDTTGALLSWTIFLLAKHPDVLHKLRAAICEHFANSQEQLVDRFSRVKSCTYLMHVLHESLRICPVVPLNSREALQDTVLPSGGGIDGTQPIAVRAGEDVLFNVYAMHRRKDLWGEDALEFKPERWQNAEKSRLLARGWAYLPFGGGPRVCLGQQFALNEAGYCLIRLLQKFDTIEIAPDAAYNEPGAMPAKKIGAGSAPAELRVRFHEA